MDASDLLYRTLHGMGIHVEREPDGVRMPAGFRLRATWTHQDTRPEGYLLGADVEVTHPELLPEGRTLEALYWGEDRAQSESVIFGQWASYILPPLHDALVERAELTMELARPRPDGTRRRILLGPILRLVDEEAGSREPAPHDPECPCCPFRHVMDAMPADAPGTRIVHVSVIRLADGRVSGEAHVDGVDVPPMSDALVAWARTWPTVGDDERRQLWVFQG